MNSEKRSRMCRAGLMLAFLAIFTGAASRRGFAQSTTEGAIGGTVTDQSKAVVPGATVTAKNIATNTTTTAVTDASGHFTVIRLNPGTYTVDVSLSGFTPFNQGGIIVEVGRVTNMDVTISVGGPGRVGQCRRPGAGHQPRIVRPLDEHQSDVDREPAGQRAALVELRAEYARRGA